MDINNVTVTGRATKDTEVRTTTSGKEVATISLAVNGMSEKVNLFDVMSEKVNFFDVVCWGKTAEIAGKFVQKGKQVAVSGRLQQRKWQDKDGNNRNAFEIVANQVKLLGGNESKDTAKEISDEAISLKDLPF